MAEIRPEEIERVLQNPSFMALLERMKDAKARKVLATSTLPEEREAFVQEYHALGRVIAELEKHANSA